MKILVATFLLGCLSTVVSADDALRGKLVGIWWGTMKITHGAKLGWNRHWLIERMENGRYKKQEFMVDPKLKVYCTIPSRSGVGSWRLVGKDLLTHQLDEGSTETDPVSVHEGKIRWKGASMSGPGAEWECEEFSVPKFEPHLDATYRSLTTDEFRVRFNKQGEQAGAGQPATRSESKSDGNENPNHEAEGRSR